MTELTLFGEVVAPTAPPMCRTSDQRRLTLRQKDAIAQGRHPLRGGAILDGKTCGECVHRVLQYGNDRRYPKCDLTSMAHSAVSDCRAWWPACTSFEAKS